MKNLLRLLIIFFLSACTDRQTDSLIEQAESYLDNQPDSTLILLHKIKKPDHLPELLKAKYNLYHTIAEIREGKNIRTDSLVARAIDIFIAGNDSINVSHACLWAGFICMQNNNYMRADSFFVRGIPYATDAKTRTDLYGYSGICCLNNRMPKQALHQYLKALRDTAFISISYKAAVLADIGQAYRYTGQADSAIVYYKKAIQQLQNTNTTNQATFFYEKISEIEKERGNIKNATDALKLALTSGNRRRNYPFRMLAQAQIYIAAGETDSARAYLKYAIQSTDPYIATRAYQLQAILNERNNNNEQLFYAWKNYEQSLSDIASSLRMDVMKQQYQEELLKNENNELKLKKKQTDIYLLSLCLILMTACAIWYIIYNRLRKKKIISEQQLKEQELKNQVAQLEKERELISLRERATALREQLFRRLSATQKIPSLSGKTKDGVEENKSRLTPEEIDELIQTVNEIWSGFAERLKETYPLLRTKDIAFCCLLKSGISTKDLASIYYITPSAISQKKARMKREKFGLTNDSLTLDEVLDAF